MRVLLAEDDPMMRRLLEAYLRRWGYEVTIARDGTEAWEQLQREDAPRLALFDWMMPGIAGTELCARVRERKQGDAYTYLVLLTGRESDDDVIRGLDAGADDYVRKPFNAEELRARLRAGQRMLELHQQLENARDALRFQATHDALMGTLNRAAGLEALESELAKLSPAGGAVGIALVDVDHFKRINDTLGHPAGDAVLREVARRIRASVRPGDTVSRYGGEELLLVLPGCDPAEVPLVAERVRAAISSEPIVVEGVSLDVTASFGVASTTTGTTGGQGIVARADKALYAAKAAGRDRVHIAHRSIGAPANVAFTSS